MNVTRFIIGAAVLSLAQTVSLQAQAQNVKLYEKAPSVEELQRQLTGDGADVGGEQPAGKRKIRTRAIVFGDAPKQEAASPPAPVNAPSQQPAQPIQQVQQPVQQPAPQQAASASRPVAAVVQQPVQQPVQTAAPQVSERAIAFPINFRVNSADVMPESIPFIESIVGLMRKDPNMHLVIEGHTDASGSVARNLALSRERAFSIMNYLIDNYRIDALRLVPVGKGSKEPLAGTEPTNPKNRRVQFRVIG